jgi:hypothetical protein
LTDEGLPERAASANELPYDYLHEGTNVIAVHAINVAYSSSDFVVDMELLHPGSQSLDGTPPSPGARNAVWSTNAPPAIRQVEHSPNEPKAGEPIVVSAKVTDPDRVASVELSYQTVEPGNYLAAYLPLLAVSLLVTTTTISGSIRSPQDPPLPAKGRR